MTSSSTDHHRLVRTLACRAQTAWLVSPIPDQGRVIRYGTGATLFYNDIDLWLFNPTPITFQLRIWLTDTLINGEMPDCRTATTSMPKANVSANQAAQGSATMKSGMMR